MGKGEVRWLIRQLKITPRKLTAPSSFDERLRVQKAVFLLKCLGVSSFKDYVFNLYLHGPYSSGLAAEYYKLEEVKPEEPIELNRANKATLKWFTSKEEKWLEVASSILSLRERYGSVTEEEIYSTLKLSKPWVEKPLYESVTRDLVKHRLLSP